MNMSETGNLKQEVREEIERVYQKPYMQIRSEQAQQHAVALLDELKAMTERYVSLRRDEGLHVTAATNNAYRLINLCEPGI